MFTTLCLYLGQTCPQEGKQLSLGFEMLMSGDIRRLGDLQAGIRSVVSLSCLLFCLTLEITLRLLCPGASVPHSQGKTCPPSSTTAL